MARRLVVSVLLSVPLCPAPLAHAAAQPDVAVEYTVHLDAPQTQTVRVRMTIRDVHTDTLELLLPTWRPGRYVILDFAGTVRQVRALDDDGRALPIAKSDKTTWRVQTLGRPTVHVDYDIYANSLADRTRHVDDSHAFLSGSSVFLLEPTRRHQPAIVRILAPPDWAVATGLEPLADDPRTLLAPSYDVLVDSPIEIGQHQRIDFDVAGLPHHIVLWGHADWHTFNLADDFAQIIQTQRDIFGHLPYRRFVFIVHIAQGLRGGTEHLNSTVLQTSPDAFHSRDAYRRFLRLVAHETFHSWNVKQLRPAGLHPYDYTRENYTDLLWVAEGTTSYYDDLTLVRAGLLDPDDYLEQLSDAIHAYRTRPGRRLQSLAQASFDAWIKFNRPTPDSVNATVSFYDVGALVSLMLDMELRQHSANAVSLDHVLAEMYRRFPLAGPGYTQTDLLDTLAELSGRDFLPFFQRYVMGTEELDLESALHAAGLELVLEPEPDDDEAHRSDPGPTLPGDLASRAYLGLDLDDDPTAQLPRIRSVRADGPAYAAGAQAGDLLVALDGQHVSADDFPHRLKQIAPGQRVELVVLRRGQLHTIAFDADAQPDARWTIRTRQAASVDQIRLYESWLGQPWPARDPSPDIAAVLDDWHDAAAHADFDRYFRHFTDDAVFLGTDASERWSVEAFRDYARPHFDAGRAWTFRPRDRHIIVADDRRLAWFDELLDSDHLGLCRGSGVLRRVDDQWKIAHYTLSFTIPNQHARDVVQLLTNPADHDAPR